MSLAVPLCQAQDETVFMSILSNQQHRLNSAENPEVGLFVSTDRGVSWRHLGWEGYIRTFYTEEGADGVLWSACGNGVLRSADGGVSWRITTGWEITEVLKVHVSPADPHTVFGATAYGIIRTTDGGATWRAMTRGFHRTFTEDVCIDRAHPSHVLVAGEEGVYESRNNGGYWKLSSLRGTITNLVVEHPAEAKEFWAGTEERGLFRSTDGGRTWQQSNAGLSHLTIYALAFDGLHPQMMYAGTYGGGVYRSSDGGASWTQKVRGLKNLEVHSLLVLPGAVLAGTLNGGLFRSTDQGEEWEFQDQEGAQVWGLSAAALRNQQ